MDIDSGDIEPVSVNNLRTIAAPAACGNRTEDRPFAVDRAAANRPSRKKSCEMLETVVNVQKASDRDSFYTQAATSRSSKESAWMLGLCWCGTKKPGV